MTGNGSKRLYQRSPRHKQLCRLNRRFSSAQIHGPRNVRLPIGMIVEDQDIQSIDADLESIA
jgi:hypothetical protein